MPDVGGQLLDVVVAIAFVFLALSLVCSFAHEVVALVLSWRSEFLERGLRNMLQADPEQKGDTLTDRLLGSPFIEEKVGRTVLRRRPNVPSYLSSRTFALALLDALAPEGPRARQLQAVEEQLDSVVPDGEIRRQLEVLLDDAGGELDRFRQGLEGWFDDMMDRVSGWYKRRAQVALLVIGLVVAVAANADALQITDRLWKDDAVRAAVVAEAGQATEAGSPEELRKRLEERAGVIDGVKQLDLPLGWNAGNGEPADLTFSGGRENAFMWLVGVVLSAIALSFGAPFWFDALSRLARLRITGRRPADRT